MHNQSASDADTPKIHSRLLASARFDRLTTSPGGRRVARSRSNDDTSKDNAIPLADKG
jgi:hypothetical protein